jgi:hypothetical protein
MNSLGLNGAKIKIVKEQPHAFKEYKEKIQGIKNDIFSTKGTLESLGSYSYFTICPNPYTREFVEEFGTYYDEDADDYQREPFVHDVIESKSDPIYMAHTYHTKVPYKAIVQYIEHFTKKGDLVFDGFCGSGMTGVACQYSGRNSILSDLSPVSAFLTYNYNSRITEEDLFQEAIKIIEDVEKEFSWIYCTKDDNGIERTVNYTIWSDIFVCPYCDLEYVYWDRAIDHNTLKLNKEYACSGCQATISKKVSKRARVEIYDKYIDQNIVVSKQEPVFINYFIGKKNYTKKLDKYDRDLYSAINEMDIPYAFPIDKIPEGYNTRQAMNSHGFINVHHYFTKKNLTVLSALFTKALKSVNKNEILFIITSFLVKTGSKFHNIGFKGGKINLAGAMPNALFIPSLIWSSSKN